MTRAYVLDRTTRATLGLVDQSWERLTYVRRYFAMDTFELRINRARLWASELQKRRLLYLPDEDDRIFLIEQVASLAEGSAKNDVMTVSGRSLEGIGMADRSVVPAAGSDYDKQTAVAAETAIKHYVSDHASASALTVARRIPGLVVVASGGAGAAVTVAGRYQLVLDVVREIGLLAGMGWEITYDPVGDEFVFDTIVGVDRSASVFFDFAFETLERWEELDSLLDSKTVAIVAGQGEGKDRDIQIRWQGTEPSGFDRREAFIDARDVELGDTTTLQKRGDAFLAAAAPERRLDAGVHQYGSFKYGEHWDLGDLVTVRNEERGLEYTARVVEVAKSFEKSVAAPVVTAFLDRPFPTIRERVSGAGAPGGAIDYPVSVADSAGPDANVTVDAAGAAGTVGTRARSQHGHRLDTSSATPSEVGLPTGAAGTSGTAPSRGDHRHELASGTSFPGSPTTNERFFRSDLGMEFYYDGTRWLSTTLFETFLPIVSGVSATGGDSTTPPLARAPTPNLRGGTNIWLVDANLSGFFVAAGGSALSASHKWLVRLDIIAPGGTLNDRASFTIDSGASDVWRQGTPGPTAAIDVLMGAQTHFSMAVVKTGTPGNLSANLSVTYRIVAT